MDEKTREALEGSISKWQAIVDGTGVDDGTANCPLCQMFYEEVDEEDGDWEDIHCHGCPVREKTGKPDCDGTPFYEWRATVPYTQNYPYRAITEEQKSAAKEELEFLKSLRPTEDR